MKKILIWSIFAGLSLPAMAQMEDIWGDVTILLDSYGKSISRDGTFSAGEAVSVQGAWGRDNTTGEVFFYENCTLGYGNCISKDHVVVGTDKTYMKAAILTNGGSPELVPSLKKYSDSYLYAINWEGTRLIGIVANPKSSDLDEYDPEKMTMMYLPIYCDIDPNTGEISAAQYLPTPEKDFFGVRPQYCTAMWISDDGMTILGQVVDNTGFYIYPIVYKQDATTGEWSYELPSEKLFNPDNVEIPVWPELKENAPQAEDFIKDPERKAEFERLLEEWNNNYEAVDPYAMLDPATNGDDALMNQEEWMAYQRAISEYEVYIESEYTPLVDEYYAKMAYIQATSPSFLQTSMSMNMTGTLVAQAQIKTITDGPLVLSYQIPYLFNLETGTYTQYGSLEEKTNLQIQQILSDGTLIATSPKPGPSTPDLTPQLTYVCAPNSTKFVKFEDYIKESNPEVYEWYQEYLTHEVAIGYNELTGEINNVDMVVTGWVAVSDDFSAAVGGVDAWSWDYEDGDYYAYFLANLANPNAGVEAIKADVLTNGYKVYNLQGVKVLETKDSSAIKELTHGIYIINGKKVAL